MFHYALYICPCSYATQAGTRRGALAVVLSSVPGGPASTASFDHSSPLPSALQSNGTGGDAAFSVSLGDAGARVSLWPRRCCWALPLGPCGGAAAFSPPLAALDVA